MSVLERTTETKVSEYAEAKGCLALKLNVMGRRGWPDRLYIYKGQVLFIEFKRLGEQPRKLQEYIHANIRKHGFDVELVDNEQQGYAAINHFTAQGDYLRRVREG